MKKGTVAVILAAVLLFSALLSNSDSLIRKSSPSAVRGEIDLSSWNFTQNGAAPLNGEWECYDGQLLTPADFTAGAQKPHLTGYADLTSGRSWNPSLRLTAPKGVRTYRLLVRLTPSQQEYGITVDNVKMSSLLYVGGALRGESGEAAAQGDGYEATSRPYDAYFSAQGDQVQLLLQVANYDYPFYGTQYTLRFGLQKDIAASDEIRGGIELCSAILSLLLAAFYLCLYAMWRKEKSFLFTACQFFSLFVLLLVSGKELIYMLLPQLPFELLGKLQVLPLFGIIVSIVSYIKCGSGAFLPDWFVRTVYWACGAYAVFILAVPYAVYVYLTGLCYAMAVLIFLMLLWVLSRSYQASAEPLQKTEILLNGLCCGAVLVGLGNNFLYNFAWAPSNAIGSAAACLFDLLAMLSIALRLTSNYDRMVKMDRAKDEFLTRSSYELKAPLNSILNLADSAPLQNAPDGEQQAAWTFALIGETARRSIQLISATMDVTLLHNDQLKLNPSAVDLKAIASLAAESARYAARGKDIAIEAGLSESLFATADESRVRQILHSLIENSVKSMDRGAIRIGGGKDGGTVFVSVEDDGCGIPPERREDIFEPYRAFYAQGIGLGLYLSRLLAERMGGSLRLEWSEVGRGSRFVLTLPVAQPALGPAGADAVNQLSFGNPLPPSADRFHEFSPLIREARNGESENTVLVVDDEMFNVQTALDLLQKDGYRVLTAFSGEEGLRKIAEEPVDLVILDVTLPGSSGIAACRQIRENHSLIELPVLLSAIGSTSYDLDLDLGLNAGANDFLHKPFEEKEMLARVRTLITMKKAMEDAMRNELNFLQAQIRPHFIYNAINTMISFCYADGERAAKLLTDFSKYLRLTFDVDRQSPTVPLRREIELIHAYMEIERARFGDKIRIEYDVDAELMPLEIPSLILQPLVENAVKHGLRHREEGGVVTLSGKRKDGVLTLTVQDTGVGMSPEQLEKLKNPERAGGSVGLTNVAKRLGRWKGARLEIESTQGLGTVCSVVVALSPENTQRRNGFESDPD